MSADRARPLTWALHLANGAVLLATAVRVARLWDQLPQRVPMHFNYAGEADRWAARGPGFDVLFALPLVVVLVSYGIWGALGHFARRPELANLPPRLQGMPPEALAPFFDALRGSVLLCCTAVNLALGSALWGTMEVALGRAPAMPGWTTPQTWVPLMAAALVWGVLRTFLASRRIGRGE